MGEGEGGGGLLPYISHIGMCRLKGYSFCAYRHLFTAILRKVVGKYVHATIPKGNMGYDQYTVPGFVAVEPTFVAFL